MSDQLAAAAQAMGIPEALAERSARARAEASGQTYEEVLAAWAGGEAVAAAPAAAEEPAEEEAVPETPPEEEAPSAPEPEQPAPSPPAAPPDETARPAATPGRPPVLQAPPDRPLVSIAGGLGVLILVILLGFVFPALPVESDQVRSSHIDLSQGAQRGRQAYLSAGCASCHTQTVRAVVADVGLGPVSLADTNQVIGFRRIGPDLSDVGSRLGPEQLRAIVTGPDHAATTLSADDLDALISYLGESATAPPGGGAS